MRTMDLDECFLSSAAKYWSPQDHVFHFIDVKICPLLEDFAAILGKSYTSSSIPMALPILEPNFLAFMVPLFDLRPHILLSYSNNGMLTLPELLENYKHKTVSCPRGFLLFLYMQLTC